jgi:hypothetical protein
VRTNASTTFASLQLPSGMHHRWVPVAEAERLMARGDCRRMRLAGAKSVGRTRPTYRLVARPDPSESEYTPCSITLSDTMAALGLAGSHNVREAAKIKIREYRRVQQHDPMYVQT